MNILKRGDPVSSWLVRFSTSAVALLLVSASLWAQGGGTAQISGTVRDATGLAVPAAEIQVTQTDTGVTRTTQSAADGTYSLPSLPIGPYRLQVGKAGFTSYAQTGIVLQVDSNPTIDASLKVGSVTERVEVTADAAMVETHSTGVGQVVDQQRVVELPLNGRNDLTLIFLGGGATTAPPGNLNSTKNYPTVVISVAGGLANGLTFLLDGSTHNDPFSNQALPFPFPDALQEFKVETSALPAQYGQHSAAAVNAVTKSGGNSFHGDAFEFLRNGDFNARDAFAPSRDTLKRNQFGGTFGGPIRRNKIFFFLGYQGTLNRSDPSGGVAFIPTPAMQAGDFTAFESPACNNGIQKNLAAPFVGNKISPSLVDPSALAIMKFYPVTNDPCGKLNFGTVQDSDEHLALARIDYQLSDKHSFFTRYYGAHLLQQSPYPPHGDPLQLVNAGINVFPESFSFGDTWLPRSDLVNSFHATFNRGPLTKFQNEGIGPQDVGINAVTLVPGLPHDMVLTAGTFYTAMVFAPTGNYDSTAMQAADDLSFQKGSHQLGFGGNWIHSLENMTVNPNSAANWTFTGTYTGTALADFMTGQTASFSEGNPALMYTRQQYVSLYAQDNWRVKPRLSISYGLRWEPYLPIYFKNDRVFQFSQSAFLANTHSSVYPNAPAGLTFPGDPGFPGNSGTNSNLSKVAPRVGLVWDPMGDGKMTVRAAYGMFYSTEHLFYDAGFGYDAAWGYSTSLAGVKLENPWATYPGGNPFPTPPLSGSSKFPANGGYVTYQPNVNPTYMQQWNLSVQRQFGANWLVSASYLGNNTIHAWTYNPINPGVDIPGATAGNIATRRALYLENPAQGGAYGTVTQQDDGGTASYNSGLFSVQHRLANNFTLLANYTWSHCISDPIVNDLGTAYTQPNNRRYDRGNCSGIDRRHIVNISGVYQTPQFAGRALRIAASGWRISTIVTMQSGQWMTVTSGTDNALNGVATGQRPNQVLSDPYAAHQSATQWLNPAAFVPAATGTYGFVGISNLLGPGELQIDASIARTFAIREKQKLEFRAEVFNLPNRINLNTPVSLALNSPQFGQITSDITTSQGAQAAGSGPQPGDPRIIQLALKFLF
jgi:hypothetical protein